MRRVLLMAAFVCLAWLALRRHGENAAAPRSVRVAATRRAPSAVAVASSVPAPPRSLAGTEVDGQLAADANGELILSAELRRFFEYFFAASGEDSEAVIRARVFAALAARLPPRAAAQARELEGRFVAFRVAATRLEPGRSVDESLAAIRDLRRDVFGADVDAALFGDVESQDDAARARRAERRSSGHDVDLAAGGEATAPLATLRAEDELRSAGAAPDAIHGLREARLGPEAAVRLDALDRARADFSARLADLRAERAAGADVSGLLAARFTLEEAVRVRALERLRGSPLP